MKRFISVILAALLVSCTVASAFAEEFQLRNGILFGDTLDDVKKKETLELSSEEDAVNDVLFRGTIAGMEGSVTYHFNEETGALDDMVYKFDSTSESSFIDNDYSTLYNSLKRKYGSPLGNTGGSIHMITGAAIHDGAFLISLMRLLNGAGDYRDYDEWVVKMNGYNVKIDLFCFYTRDKDFNYTYRNYLSYHYFTDADYEKALQDKLDENAAVDNDL